MLLKYTVPYLEKSISDNGTVSFQIAIEISICQVNLTKSVEYLKYWFPQTNFYNVNCILKKNLLWIHVYMLIVNLVDWVDIFVLIQFAKYLSITTFSHFSALNMFYLVQIKCHARTKSLRLCSKLNLYHKQINYSRSDMLSQEWVYETFKC
jgi:hypothetical protein